jgi:predicted ATPase
MTTTIIAKNFRRLADVRLTVSAGLSAVVGTNGAGKTTLGFIGDILKRATASGSAGLTAAIEFYGGGRNLKYLGASPEEPVVLGIETGGIRWEIEPVPSAGGIASNPAERLFVGERPIFERSAGRTEIDWNDKTIRLKDDRTVLRRLMDGTLEGEFPGAPVLDLISGYQLHYDVDIIGVRNGSPDGSQRSLSPNGDNVFSVLRNWRDWTEDKPRFEFVLDALRECFGFFGGMDFLKSGKVIEGHIQHRGFNGARIPAGFEANGVLSALMSFTAVASASRGQLVYIDEFETSLHPRSVREALGLIQQYAEQEDISVVVATQSTEVLNWFDGRPDRILVMDSRVRPSPSPLTDLRSAQWLSHFRLGDKYAEGDFGAEESEP